MTPIPPIPEDELVEWGVGLMGLMHPMKFGGWYEKWAVDQRIAKLTAALDAFMELPHLFDDVCDCGANCEVCHAIRAST